MEDPAEEEDGDGEGEVLKLRLVIMQMSLISHLLLIRAITDLCTNVCDEVILVNVCASLHSQNHKKRSSIGKRLASECVESLHNWQLG